MAERTSPGNKIKSFFSIGKSSKQDVRLPADSEMSRKIAADKKSLGELTVICVFDAGGTKLLNIELSLFLYGSSHISLSLGAIIP